MSMSDPIADMIIRVNNAQRARHAAVAMPASKVKTAIADVLKSEGYITDYSVETNDNKPTLSIALKYINALPVIRDIKRVSKPSLRIYKKAAELTQLAGGYGIAIVSTPSGVLSSHKAQQLGVGGEVICYVW